MLNFKAFLLISSTLIFSFELYLSVRQWQKIVSVKKRTSQVEPLISEDEFHKVRAYSLDKIKFEMISSIFSQIVFLIFIHFDGLSLFWDYSSRALIALGFKLAGNVADWEISRSIIWLLLLMGGNMIISLPFSLYFTFVIEERHGFNKQTFGLFVSDFIKSILISVPILSLLVFGLLKIIRLTGDNYYIYAWLLIFTFQMTMITIYPTFIQPLFNKVQPLEEDDTHLKSKIEDLAKQNNFPLKKLFVIDGSKRSSHSNAYLYGFGQNKRIVLFDTLIQQLETNEILSVLLHEIGHWYYSHAIKMLVIAQIDVFLQFYFFGKFKDNAEMLQSFGFDLTFNTFKPAIVSLTIYFMLISPIESVTKFFYNLFMRHNEYQADEFASKTGAEQAQFLQKALIKISKENKGWLNYDSLYSAYHHSHPQVVDRISRLQELIESKKSK